MPREMDATCRADFLGLGSSLRSSAIRSEPAMQMKPPAAKSITSGIKPSIEKPIINEVVTSNIAVSAVKKLKKSASFLETAVN